MTIAIIGKSGQLAQELLDTKPSGMFCSFFGRDDIDILSTESINKTLDSIEPNGLINASAYTQVDKAEEEPEQAFAINEIAVANLCHYAKKKNIPFIHISTDFVFDGDSTRPYKTSDNPNPLNVYGASKLAGEMAIQDIYPENSSIIRTSWLYSHYGNNFVKTMLRLFQEKDEIRVVSDQYGCPTSATGLARFLWYLLDLSERELIYHWSDKMVNSQGISWYQFAIEIQKVAFEKGLIQSKIPIIPISTSEYPTAAKRPQYSVLDCYNLDPDTKNEQPDWLNKLLFQIENIFHS